jgi:hypothetical protein
VAEVLLRFLSLLSYAHVRDEQGRPRPLLHVEVRRDDARPRFAWCMTV